MKLGGRNINIWVRLLAQLHGPWLEQEQALADAIVALVETQEEYERFQCAEWQEHGGPKCVDSGHHLNDAFEELNIDPDLYRQLKERMK